jgi:hypothetical protein
MSAQYMGDKSYNNIPAELWKQIGIPKMLYGRELWQLNRPWHGMQGLLQGISGSAAQGDELDKRNRG